MDPLRDPGKHILTLKMTQKQVLSHVAIALGLAAEIAHFLTLLHNTTSDLRGATWMQLAYKLTFVAGDWLFFFFPAIIFVVVAARDAEDHVTRKLYFAAGAVASATLLYTNLLGGATYIVFFGGAALTLMLSEWSRREKSLYEMQQDRLPFQ
ncbi:uncharacterized protein YALI1_F35647g [Yarrowia lipolytica]|uniref:Uncharacterized protein n=1 Tax=Yarrowia lipolytica TaxID=4952 RepID=A0A1D8NQA8_YARLL|nr:hypothetical protein YALI1_F35647g [Yarrowia lipolytica]